MVFDLGLEPPDDGSISPDVGGIFQNDLPILPRARGDTVHHNGALPSKGSPILFFFYNKINCALLEGERDKVSNGNEQNFRHPLCRHQLQVN